MKIEEQNSKRPRKIVTKDEEWKIMKTENEKPNWSGNQRK